MNTTSHIIDRFIDFLNQALPKSLGGDIQVLDWKLDNYKVNIRYRFENKTNSFLVDAREIEDNIDRFSHLLDNITDQILQK